MLCHVDGDTRGHNDDEEVSAKDVLGVLSNDACELIFVHSIAKSSLMAQKSSSKAIIPSTWILLDSQSTIDVFCNAE